MIRLLACLLLLGAIGAITDPAVATAQVAPNVDKKQVAKQYVNAGLAAQSSGDYDTAITFYSKAYELVQHPTLIFNIAQAHRLAGHIEQALTSYKRYLAEDPNGPQAKTARELISVLERRKADEARRAEMRKADDTPKADEARDADEARTSRPQQVADGGSSDPATEAPAMAPRDAASPDVPQPGRSLRYAGLAAGAGGVAALAIGIGFGLHARTLADEVSRDGSVYDPSKVRAGERANTIAIVGIAGGSVLIAAGAALYWWGYTQSRSTERVSLVPMVSHDTAGLVLSGALP